MDLSALLCLQGQVKKLKKQVVLSPRESKSFSLDFNLYREEVLDNSILKNTDDSRIISPLRQVLEYNLNKVRFENFFYFYLSKIDRQKPVLLSDYQFYFKDYFTSPFIKEKDKRFNVIKTTYSSKENLKRYSSVLGIFNKLGYKVLLHLNCKKEDYERAKKEVKSVFWGDNNLAILSLYPLRIKEYDDLLCESKKAN